MGRVYRLGGVHGARTVAKYVCQVAGLPDINEVDVDAHVEARSDKPEGAGPLLLPVEGFAQHSKGRFLNIRVKARQLAEFASDTARNGQISARS